MTATVSPTTTGYTNLGMGIRQHFEELGPMFALDTETAMAPVCFGGRDHVRLLQCWSSTHAFWLDLAELDDADWAELKDCLEQEHLTLVMQNAAFDIRVLQGCGIRLRGTIHDTMLLSWLLNNGIPNVSNSLEAIAHRELDLKLDKTFQKASWMTLDLKANPEAVSYGMNDVCATWGAFHKLFSKVIEQGLDIAYEVELKAILPTIQMESTGLYLDRNLLDEQVVELRETRDGALAMFIETLDAELQEAGHEGLPRLEDGSFNLNKVTKGSVRLGTKVYAGFNPGSSTQLLKLFPLVDVEPTDPAGKPSIDKKFLAAFRHMPVVDYYLTWKRCDKHIQMATTLVEAQQDDGRIYARFNQTGTFTGRYSCVSGDTLLETTRGTFRFDEYEPQVGDRVLTHMGQLRQVVRKIYKGEGRMFCISTKLGGQLTCTADHRLLTPSGWKRVGQLQPGDTVVGIQSVGVQPSKHPSGHLDLQGRGQADASAGGRSLAHAFSQHLLCAEASHAGRGVQGREGVAVLTKQAGALEPYAGQEWFPPSQLQGRRVGRTRLPDRARWEWRKDFPSQESDAGSSWFAITAFGVARSSHRRRPSEQQPGQPGVGNTVRSRSSAPEETTVVAITPVGSMGVWDIEVEGDHSYAAGGFLNHNSSGPNLQNIPRGAFRYCFTVPEGRAMVDLDYGGMELRALCSPRIADEPLMREAFNTGRDVHRYTASLMFGKPEEEVTDEERRQAKAVNFGAAYGSSAGGLCNYFQAIGQPITLKEGEAFLKAWLAAYPKIGRWHNLCRELVDAGAPVTMVDGRRRWLHGDSARHTIMANNIVQGSSASAMKLALAAIYDRLPAIDTTARLVGVIHDEVLIECDAEHADAILAMAEAAMVEAGKEIFGDAILLEAEGGIGDSWGGAKG